MSEKFIKDIQKMFWDKYGDECHYPSSGIQLPRFHPPKNREASDWECECGAINVGNDLNCKACAQNRYPVYFDETDDFDPYISNEYDFFNAVKRFCARQSEHIGMAEMSRLIFGLRSAGWSAEKINDFMLFIASGEEKYKPKPDKEPPAEENK